MSGQLECFVPEQFLASVLPQFAFVCLPHVSLNFAFQDNLINISVSDIKTNKSNAPSW
jgi:hypothetical protein